MNYVRKRLVGVRGATTHLGLDLYRAWRRVVSGSCGVLFFLFETLSGAGAGEVVSLELPEA